MSLFSKLTPNFWRIQLRQWHWISSALCLTGLLLFAITGFTLNHAATLEAKPRTTHVERSLPAGVVQALGAAHDKQPVPPAVAIAVKQAVGVDISRRPADISDEEIYVDLATPGVDASVTLGRDGSLVYERTTRGVVAVLNDLHKGRHAGPAWSFFIDLLAVACGLFAVTGLGLLWLYSRNRRITWPLVAAGLAAPLILYLVFVHA